LKDKQIGTQRITSLAEELIQDITKPESAEVLREASTLQNITLSDRQEGQKVQSYEADSIGVTKDSIYDTERQDTIKVSKALRKSMPVAKKEMIQLGETASHQNIKFLNECEQSVPSQELKFGDKALRKDHQIALSNITSKTEDLSINTSNLESADVAEETNLFHNVKCNVRQEGQGMQIIRAFTLETDTPVIHSPKSKLTNVEIRKAMKNSKVLGNQDLNETTGVVNPSTLPLKDSADKQTVSSSNNNITFIDINVGLNIEAMKVTSFSNMPIPMETPTMKKVTEGVVETVVKNTLAQGTSWENPEIEVGKELLKHPTVIAKYTKESDKHRHMAMGHAEEVGDDGKFSIANIQDIKQPNDLGKLIDVEAKCPDLMAVVKETKKMGYLSTNEDSSSMPLLSYHEEQAQETRTIPSGEIDNVCLVSKEVGLHMKLEDTQYLGDCKTLGQTISEKIIVSGPEMLASRNAREVVMSTDIAVASSIKDDQRESVNLSISQVVSSANEKVIKEPKTLVIIQEAEEAIATPVRNVYEESREAISINTKIGTKEKVIKQSNMVGISEKNSESVMYLGDSFCASEKMSLSPQQVNAVDKVTLISKELWENSKSSNTEQFSGTEIAQSRAEQVLDGTETGKIVLKKTNVAGFVPDKFSAHVLEPIVKTPEEKVSVTSVLKTSMEIVKSNEKCMGVDIYHDVEEVISQQQPLECYASSQPSQHRLEHGVVQALPQIQSTIADKCYMLKHSPLPVSELGTLLKDKKVKETVVCNEKEIFNNIETFATEALPQAIIKTETPRIRCSESETQQKVIATPFLHVENISEEKNLLWDEVTVPYGRITRTEEQNVSLAKQNEIQLGMKEQVMNTPELLSSTEFDQAHALWVQEVNQESRNQKYAYSSKLVGSSCKPEKVEQWKQEWNTETILPIVEKMGKNQRAQSNERMVGQNITNLHPGDLSKDNELRKEVATANYITSQGYFTVPESVAAEVFTKQPKFDEAQALSLRSETRNQASKTGNIVGVDCVEEKSRECYVKDNKIDSEQIAVPTVEVGSKQNTPVLIHRQFGFAQESGYSTPFKLADTKFVLPVSTEHENVTRLEALKSSQMMGASYIKQETKTLEKPETIEEVLKPSSVKSKAGKRAKSNERSMGVEFEGEIAQDYRSPVVQTEKGGIKYHSNKSTTTACSNVNIAGFFPLEEELISLKVRADVCENAIKDKEGVILSFANLVGKEMGLHFPEELTEEQSKDHSLVLESAKEGREHFNRSRSHSKARQMGTGIAEDCYQEMDEFSPSKEMPHTLHTQNYSERPALISAHLMGYKTTEEHPNEFSAVFPEPCSPAVSQVRQHNTEKVEIKSIPMGLVPLSEEALCYHGKDIIKETSHISPVKLKANKERVSLQSILQGKEIQKEDLPKLVVDITAKEKPTVSKTTTVATNKIKLNSQNMGLDASEETSIDLKIEVFKPEITKIVVAEATPSKMASRLSKVYGLAEKEEILAPLTKSDAKIELPTYTSNNIQVASKESNLFCMETQQESSTNFQTKPLCPEFPTVSKTKAAIRERASSRSREQGYAVELETVTKRTEIIPETEKLKLLDTINKSQERAHIKSVVFGVSLQPETAIEQKILGPISGQANVSDSSKEVKKKVLKLSKPLGVSIIS